jgi:hypothetical protein
MNILWTVVLPILVGLIGSAYAKELRALLSYGPHRLSDLRKEIQKREKGLLDLLHGRPERIAVYLGMELTELGMWGMGALMISWFVKMQGMDLSPIGLTGGLILGSLHRINKVMLKLWNYPIAPPSQGQALNSQTAL